MNNRQWWLISLDRAFGATPARLHARASPLKRHKGFIAAKSGSFRFAACRVWPHGPIRPTGLDPE
jgi:hypothetical protein